MDKVLVAVVALVFLGAIGGIVATSCRGLTGAAQDTAQKEADAFLANMGIRGKAICARSDTDGDGYISCPYTAEGKEGIQPLECASGLIMAEGCRPPKAVFVGGQR